MSTSKHNMNTNDGQKAPPLPSGWRRAESRRYPGCSYYLRPDGSATWLLPHQTRRDLPRQLQTVYREDFGADEALVARVNPRQATATARRHSSYAAHPKAEPRVYDKDTYLSLKQRDFVPFSSKPNYKPRHPPFTPRPFGHSSLYRDTYAPYRIVEGVGVGSDVAADVVVGGASEAIVVSDAAGAFALKEGGTEADGRREVADFLAKANINGPARVDLRGKGPTPPSPRPPQNTGRGDAAGTDAAAGGGTPRVVFRPSSAPRQRIASSRAALDRLRGGGGGGQPSLTPTSRSTPEVSAVSYTNEGPTRTAVPRPPLNAHTRYGRCLGAADVNDAPCGAMMRRPFRARPKDMRDIAARYGFGSASSSASARRCGTAPQTKTVGGEEESFATGVSDYAAHFVDFKPQRPLIHRPSDQVSFGHRRSFEPEDEAVKGSGGSGPRHSDPSSSSAGHQQHQSIAAGQRHSNSLYRADFKGEQPYLGRTRRAVVYATMRNVPSSYTRSLARDMYDNGVGVGADGSDGTGVVGQHAHAAGAAGNGRKGFSARPSSAPQSNAAFRERLRATDDAVVRRLKETSVLGDGY